MHIYVDADACPVKEIIVRLSKAAGLPVTMLIDTSHELPEGYAQVITVDRDRDSVDIRLINLVKRGDVVVTQDFGVAAMALGKGASAVNQNGLIFSDDNMDRLLFERHLAAKVRRAGGRTGTFKKRSSEDDAAFERSFRRLIGLEGRAQ